MHYGLPTSEDWWGRDRSTAECVLKRKMCLPTTLLLEAGRVAGEALMNLSGSFPNP